MSAFHFFMEEDLYGAVAAALRRAGIDAVSTPETGRHRQSDESQLEWAAVEGRVLITFNAAHFAQLHAHWLGQRRHHAGIVVSSQRPIGDVVRRLLHVAGTKHAELMHDHLEFLSDW